MADISLLMGVRMILPGVVQEIADVIGSEAALYLVGQLPTCEVWAKSGASWGNGKRVQSKRVMLYVPKRLTDDHRLVQILGMDRAHQLVLAFGGENFILPNCREVYSRFRDAEMRRMSSEGMTNAEIADIIGVGVRTVRNLTFANDNVPKAANDNVAREKPQEE